MRTFIAIDLPPKIKDKINRVQNDLKKHKMPFRWVKPDNLHITLKFLGNTEEKDITAIQEIISDVARLFNPFEASFNKFGFFPNKKRPRVFFISTSNEEILRKIAAAFENKLAQLNFNKGNEFKAHVTIARIKDLKNLDFFRKEVEDTSLEENFSVKKITLFKSTLTQQHPIYEKIFSARMTAGNIGR